MYLNSINFAEKDLLGGYAASCKHTVCQKCARAYTQCYENAPALTNCVARTRPRLHTVSQERVRAYIRDMLSNISLAYIGCRENASALHAPFILDLSGPTEFKRLPRVSTL